MSIIKIENLTFSYPSSSDNIFENANFQIDTDWKLGFVGRNGRGKTTLLNLLLGKYKYSGKITSSVQFDYFPYAVSDKSQTAAEIFREICPLAEEWELIRELSYLDVDSDILWSPFQFLSEGERTKILLAALFLNEGHFLLIDEPTNHLDIKAREIVAAYLKKKKSFILVSHDRRFIDGCVDHILSINRSDIQVQSGNFSSFMKNFEMRQKSEAVQNERIKKDIDRLNQAARRAASWSDQTEASKFGTRPPDRGYIGHKAAKMMKRSKNIEKRREQAAEEKSKLLKNMEKTESLKLSPLTHYADTLASFYDVSPCYNGKAVCRTVSFSVIQGDRIVLDGKNGSGKSSLLKLLAVKSGVLSRQNSSLSFEAHNMLENTAFSYTGNISIASGLVISYVPQDTSHLCGLLSDYAYNCKIDETLFKTILRKMNFERIQFEKDIRDFSSGQKKKVLIARSLCERAHLYIWDEPLNFIDVYSRMQIEMLISEFSPTMLFVEHDSAFREKIATKTVHI